MSLRILASCRVCFQYLRAKTIESKSSLVLVCLVQLLINYILLPDFGIQMTFDDNCK